MRGLKLVDGEEETGSEVASFTDAWIETLKTLLSLQKKLVASFTDAWIETCLWEVMTMPPMSHLLQMRGLKQKAKQFCRESKSRIFYRCVD